MKEIKQTTSQGKIVGVLLEKDLKVVNDTVEVNGSSKNCDKIAGSISIKTNNGVFKIFAPSTAKSITKEGKHNVMFDAWETVMLEYVSELDARQQDKTVVADYVSCSCEFNPYSKFNDKKGTVMNYSGIKANFVKRVDSSVPSQTEFDIEGVIRSIKPEIEKDEETGRLLVDFVTVAYGGKANVSTLIVPEDTADVFKNGYINEFGDTIDGYVNGDMCVLSINLKMVQKGTVRATNKGFGKQSNTTNGFEVQELEIFNGQPAYRDTEDSDITSKIISIDDLKELMNERDIYLEELANKGKTEKPKAKGLGNKKPLADEDIPF